MFKFLRKGLEKLGIIQPKKSRRPPRAVPVTRPPPKSVPVTTRPPVERIAPSVITNHIGNLFPHAKLANVRTRIRYMTPAELIWTKNANKKNIQDKARANPDREDDMGLPLNPWWYK